MEVTLESVQKNKEIYDENIKKILQERAELMKQVTELRRKRETLTDEIDIAELDFEEAKLIQQIAGLTSSFQNNKLTLEQLNAQEDILTQRISKEKYTDRIVANRKAKQDLSKQEEVEYDENEIKKCEKALKLYILMGDRESIDKWQKSLEKAQKDLTLARQDLSKGQKTEVGKDDNQEQSTSPYINEYGEIIRPDNTQTTPNIDEGYQTGYTRTEKDGVVTEEISQSIKDYSGKQIGSRTSVEKYDFNFLGGNRTVETSAVIENEDGKYTITEFGRAGEDGETIRKQMTKDNKITGNKEQIVFQRDGKGNEMYFKRINNKLAFKITKSTRGMTIDNYDNGQLLDSYEYDVDGKAIDGMGMPDIEQLDENYIESYFDSQVPYFEAENRDLPKQDKGKIDDSQTLIDSAVEATEAKTKTSTINQEVQNIKNMQKERTQQQTKQNNGQDR